MKPIIEHLRERNLGHRGAGANEPARALSGYSYAYDLKPLNLLNLVGDAKVLTNQEITLTR